MASMQSFYASAAQESQITSSSKVKCLVQFSCSLPSHLCLANKVCLMKNNLDYMSVNRI